MSGKHWLKVARRPAAAVDMEAALHAILSAAPNLLDAQAPDVPRQLSPKSMLQLASLGKQHPISVACIEAMWTPQNMPFLGHFWTWPEFWLHWTTSMTHHHGQFSACPGNWMSTSEGHLHDLTLL